MDKVARKEKLRLIGHILAGIILLIHAYEHYEKEENFWVHLLAGILFLSIAVFHHPLSKQFRWIDSVFYLLEAVAIFYTAYGYFHHGKQALPYVYIAAGVGYIIAAVLISRRKMLQQE